MLGNTLADWAELLQPASAQVGPLNWGVGPADCPVQRRARRGGARAGTDHRPRPGSFSFRRFRPAAPVSECPCCRRGCPSMRVAFPVVLGCGCHRATLLASSAAANWGCQVLAGMRAEAGVSPSVAWGRGEGGRKRSHPDRDRDLPLLRCPAVGQAAGAGGPWRPLCRGHGGFLMDSVLFPQLRLTLLQPLFVPLAANPPYPSTRAGTPHGGLLRDKTQLQ